MRRFIRRLAVIYPLLLMLFAFAPRSTAAQGMDAPTDAQPKAPTLTKPPELKTFVQAIYPPAAQSEGTNGVVILALTIQADGSVTDVEIVKAAGRGFDEAAKAAVEQFVFTPAEIDGEPGAVRIEYRYVFEVEKKVEQKSATEVRQPKEAGPPPGRLSGRLRERGTRQPLSGFEVELSSGQRVFTDEQGRFVFEKLPPGEYTLRIDEREFDAIESAESVESGKETEVTYYLERIAFGDSIVVVGKRLKKEVVRRTLTVEEIRFIPGTNGDALRIVQNLPGAARTPFGNTDLILRGGGNTQVFLNSQPIPLAFHFGGLRSTVASALIENIDIYPGNYGVQYGRVNGGIVDIKLRRPRMDGLHGYAEADVFDAGALIEGPIGDNAGFAIAARRSYFDALLQNVPSDSIAITTAPFYYDGQILFDYQTKRHQLKLLTYGSSDQFVAIIKDPPNQNPRANGRLQLALEWVGGQADWTVQMSPSVEHRLNVSWISTAAKVSLGSLLNLDFKVHQGLIRETVKWEPSKTFQLRVGTDIDLTWLDVYAYGSGGPPKEGEPRNAGGFVEAILNEEKAFWPSPAGWIEAIWGVGPVQLIPGFRLDYVGSTKDLIYQPRFTTRWQATKATALKGGAGLYVQPPEGDEVTNGLGNDNVDPERSWQVSLGAEHTFNKSVDLDLTGYYKGFYDLIRRNDDPDVRVTNEGIGRAYGIEVLLRHNLTNRFFGWIGYTLQRSERRDAEGEPWRVFDVDQTHNIIVVAQYRVTPRWRLGARWRYVTGNPTTPVTGSIFDADTDRYAPTYGAVNSDRDDAFHQLDIRIDREWVYQTWRLTAYLDLRNAYNQANAAGLEYNFDYTESQQGFDIPIIPSFGLRGEF